MTTRKYDYAVFIGRFQPFHIGHKQVIDTALSMADTVIVVIGSSNQPRTPKNPWSVPERAGMIIGGSFSGEDLKRIRIVKAQDQSNDQKWTSSIQDAVMQATLKDGWKDKLNIAIIGHDKDNSSYYLKMFPQWTLVDHEINEVVHATDLRELYFEGMNLKFLQSVVPSNVFSMLKMFRDTPTFQTLVDDYNYIKAYKKSWEAAPYAPIFVTVDACVVQSGHVLLVKRRASPNKGAWALPGGFVNQKEKLEDAMIRELREETKIKVPDPVLRGNIKSTKVFDAPDRSSRGRTITHAFHIELPPGELPKVKGSDDAEKAVWVPLTEIKGENMFEDHFFIIEHFIG